MSHDATGSLIDEELFYLRLARAKSLVSLRSAGATSNGSVRFLQTFPLRSKQLACDSAKSDAGRLREPRMASRLRDNWPSDSRQRVNSPSESSDWPDGARYLLTIIRGWAQTQLATGRPEGRQ